MEDMKLKAKKDVLKQIRDIASKLMQDDIKSMGLKKVTVASDSTKGLEEGLEKAKEMMSSKPEGSSSEDVEEMMEPEDSPEEESSEDLSSLEAQIKALEEKKQKLLNK